ncbi:MAG: hypothetical protein NXI31_07705 [bacterium]|nr:hypothetical protein [bacterium]
MHISYLIGATAVCAVLTAFWLTAGEAPNQPANAGIATATTAKPAVSPPPQLPGSGHYVLVIEGDRDALTVTHSSRKPARWAGVQKGLVSQWSLSIRDAANNELESIPLDLSHFDLRPERKGGALKVQGCVVRDTKVGILASVPCLENAARYMFLRGKEVVGSVAATRVFELAGGGR